jgi:hypothetical protein
MMNSDQREQSVSFASVSGRSHSLSCIHKMVRLKTESRLLTSGCLGKVQRIAVRD